MRIEIKAEPMRWIYHDGLGVHIRPDYDDNDSVLKCTVMARGVDGNYSDDLRLRGGHVEIILDRETDGEDDG